MADKELKKAEVSQSREDSQPREIYKERDQAESVAKKEVPANAVASQS
jgi:hypothetical protein